MRLKKVYSSPPRYYIDGREVDEDQWEAARPFRPCNFAKGESPAFRMPGQGWEQENGGRGRYISQIALKQGDRGAYCRSRGEALEKAKRRGFEAEAA